MIDWLGYLGTGLVVVAYLPQIVHLIKERCTAGLSTWAYLIWSIASVLLLFYSIVKQDFVFMTLQLYQVVTNGTITFFCLRHPHALCEAHRGPGAGALKTASSH